MYKLILLLTVSLLINGCANDSSSSTEPLRVEKIGFDSNKSIAIKQIVFEFNQDVAVLGAVPTRNQISSVSISNNLHQKCNWRFINLDKLSCELDERLKYLTNYSVEIDSQFIALGKKLTEGKSVSIATKLPTFRVNYDGNYKEFPSKITIENYTSTDISADAFNKGLMLKLPNGNTEKLLSKEVIKYQQKELSITPQINIDSLPEGFYQIVLPKGFKPSDSQVALESEVVISDFWYSKEFRFYGFACENGYYPYRFTDISLDEQNTAPCAPEKIALAFSMPLERIQQFDPKQKVDWLIGPDYVAGRISGEQLKFYQPILLSGDSNYEIDLSKIKSITEDRMEDTSIIKFRTQPATPLWKFDESFGTVVEAGGKGQPTFMRRNVEEIFQEVHVINTADELQQFVNRDSKPPMEKTLFPIAGTDTFLREQQIEFRQYLNSQRGMAHVRMTGLSSDAYSVKKPKMQTKSFMLKSVDYNLVVWHGKGLLLQAIDWQAAPIFEAQVQLVCEGLNSPLSLGMTNANGVTWLRAEQWQKISTDNLDSECWLWTQKENKFAAIQLPPVRNSTSEKLNAFAWTAQPIYQPQEVVQIGFIARNRTAQGLQPVKGLEGYRVFLQDPDGKEHQELVMSDISSQGFSSTSIDLPPEAAMGRYEIVITDIKTGVEDSIGSFFVTEFTPPEFEFDVEIPSNSAINQPYKADISAKRMNGAALKNASAALSIRILREYPAPKYWPDEYEFISWDDFDRNKNGAESIETIEVALDGQGQFKYNSEPLKSTVPFGRVQLRAEITSDDGEAQVQEFESPYFSRDHYIGTRFDSDKRELHVIAIDQQGNELNDVSVAINVIPRHPKKGETPKSLMTCSFDKLPGVCNVTIDNESVSLEIESGMKKFTWYRDYNFSKTSEKPKPNLSEKFELTSQQKTAKVGDVVKFNLVSSVAGTSSFILQVGDIQKVWTKQVQKGVNEIELKVEPSWIPYARLYASLSVDRNMARELTKSKLEATNLDSDAPISPRIMADLLSAKRLLASDELLKVTAKEDRPNVSLSLSHDEVQAGSTIKLSIEASVDSESQIWLVNEALLNLMQINDSNYDYQKALYSQNSFESGLKFDALSRHLTLDSILGEGDITEQISVTGAKMRMMAQESMALGMARHRAAMGVKGNILDFSQSVWLNTIKLSANQPSTMDIKLPQLIGRWKVLALTATNQTMSIDSTPIKTIRDVEYFLDVPTTIVEGDNADFAVAKINKTDSPITDELYLWIDDKKVSSLEVRLAPNGYKRELLALPTLKPGKYSLKLTSKVQPGFAALNTLNVIKSSVHIDKSWLVKGDAPSKIQSPHTYLGDSLQVSTMEADQQAPDWQSLTAYNESYPHQCWEQTISRAVSYQFNPMSEIEWAEGKDELNRLLSRKQNYLSYMGLYSYFPFMEPDPFLTAYTYLVSSLLAETSTPINIDTKAVKKILLNFINGDDYSSYLDVTPEAKSMSLFALAVNKDIDLKEALIIRQSLGSSDVKSALLQALALKELGASPSLYNEMLTGISNDRYIDENINVFNQNAERCLALLAYDSVSKEREALVTEVTSEQQELGHFGSTFSNAVCAYALKDTIGKGVSYQPTSFRSSENGTLVYQPSTNDAHWLKLSYEQNITDVKPKALGISIQRNLFVNRYNEWQPIDENETLEVGELVKTTISIDGSKSREHIAITDFIAGGFEAINPEIGNKLFVDSLGADWVGSNRIEIRNGKAYWYIRHLNKGKRDISYYSRVRHSGVYTIGPAKVEAMYRTDVESNTSAVTVTVKR